MLNRDWRCRCRRPQNDQGHDYSSDMLLGVSVSPMVLRTAAMRSDGRGCLEQHGVVVSVHTTIYTGKKAIFRVAETDKNCEENLEAHCLYVQPNSVRSTNDLA